MCCCFFSGLVFRSHIVRSIYQSLLWPSLPPSTIVFFLNVVISYVISWVVPPPSNSQHKDYYIFSRGSLINLHLPLLLGGGSTQVISSFPPPHPRNFFPLHLVQFIQTDSELHRTANGSGTGVVDQKGGNSMFQISVICKL